MKPYAAKIEAVLALLAADGHQLKMQRLWCCHHHIPHYATRIATKAAPFTKQVRCALKRHCPAHMRPDNIARARERDYLVMESLLGDMGCGYHGEGAQVWLIGGKTSTVPHSGAELAKALSRSDDRHKPAMYGPWAGEFAPYLEATVSLSSPQVGAPAQRLAIYNILLYAPPDSRFDEARLEAFLPGSRLERCPTIRQGWEEYLRRWAHHQLVNPSPADVVRWMVAEERCFQSLGAIRGIKTRDEKAYSRTRQQKNGRTRVVGFYNRLDFPTEVIHAIDHNLDSHWMELHDRGPMPQNEHARTMSHIKPQVKGALVVVPAIEPLRQELEALKQRVEVIEEAIAPEDRPKLVDIIARRVQ